MEELKIILSVIDAVGSLATAIGVIIALMKFRKKLKIKGKKFNGNYCNFGV